MANGEQTKPKLQESKQEKMENQVQHKTAESELDSIFNALATIRTTQASITEIQLDGPWVYGVASRDLEKISMGLLVRPEDLGSVKMRRKDSRPVGH
jgi:hypothetical protein